MAAITLEQIKWNETPLMTPAPNPEIEKQVKQMMGSVPATLPYISSVPWLVKAQVVTHLYPASHLPNDLDHLTGLVVAMDNSCRYC